jgi:TolB-like protein/class 3 adenylate cyclase/lipoprotein NlpI
MAQEGFKRKLAAILSADVEGYGRLMDDDEEATVRTLTFYRTAIADLVQQFRGRIVDTPGDNILAEFTSVVDAINCGVEIQRDLLERNAELPYNRKMQFRIGVNLGDVIEEKGRIYGDGVNIAARVESLSDAGGICISGRAYDQVANKLGLEYENLGEHQVKNISTPIRVYKVLSLPGKDSQKEVQAKEALKRNWRKIAFSIALTLAVAAVGFGIRQFYLRRPSLEPASVEKMAFPLPEKPSIAVLPFENLSDDPEQEYFSDGITDDLITDLSKISGLFVIARNSSFSYKGQPVKIKKVAEELGVHYVLEGSVRKFGEKIRINAQLIDATTGGHLWAERYDREYKDIFALQDEVIQQIVSALSVKLTRREEAQLTTKLTDNLEAYDYYLRGEQFLHSLSSEGLTKAKSMFEKAIELDPKFAQAYAAQAMADYYIWRYDIYAPGIDISLDHRREAYQLVTKALAMNNNLPIAHSVLAGLHLGERQYEKAIASAAMAVALDPNNAESHVMQSYVLTKAGRHGLAKKAIDMAYRLNPNPPPYYYFYLSEVQFNLRKYSESIESIKKVGNAIPVWAISYYLVPNYAYLGRLDEARAELEKILEVESQIDIKELEKPSVFLYRLEEDTKHRIEGFVKAGLPRVLNVYEKVMEDLLVNMLSGEEIKALSVGRTWNGFNPKGSGRWLIIFAKEGNLRTEGVWGSESGSYWIEEYRICFNWQVPIQGQDGCGFVYRIPKGTAEEMNEYEWVSHSGVYPFSLVD